MLPFARVTWICEGRTANVLTVWVAEPCRRKGWGTYLLWLLAARLKAARRWRVELDAMVEPGNDFYTRLGFEPCADVGPEVAVQTLVLLQKAAGPRRRVRVREAKDQIELFSQ